MAEPHTRNHATDEITEPVRPDPSRRQRPVRAWAKWAVGVFVVCLVVFVLYALNAPGPEPQVGATVQKSTTSSPPGPSTTGSGSK